MARLKYSSCRNNFMPLFPLILFSYLVKASSPTPRRRLCEGMITVCERMTTRCKFSCYSGKDNFDLSTLDGNRDRPRNIKDVSSATTSYQWSPCTRFAKTCADLVYVCQVNANRQNDDLGDEEPTVAFDNIRNQYFLSYLGPVKDKLGERKTMVHLEYDDQSTGRTSPMINHGNYYTMTLYTKYAPHSDGGNSGGLSTGSILLIVFFCVVVAYLGVGMMFTKYKRGARGKEIIPHYSFWSQIPSLAKDGCSYTYTLIKGYGSSAASKVTERRNYEEI